MKKRCVYRIECKDPKIQQIYIGSSLDLDNRIGSHKYSCNTPKSKEYNTPVYKFIREHGGWDNWKFDIEQDCYRMIEEDIIILEQTFIDCLNPELNSINASGQDRNEYMKEYRENNKESIKEYNNDYMKEYKKSDKYKQSKKNYYENNKESIKQYQKEYGKIKANCPHCDKEMNKTSINKHIKAIHPSI